MKRIAVFAFLFTTVAGSACDVNVNGDDEGGATEGSDDAGDGASDSSGGAGSEEAQLCQRIDECGLLEPGYSVGDCTDVVSACTDDLLTSAKADWDGAAQGCLDLENCQNFGSCYLAIDVCIDLESDGPGSGTGGGGDGPGDGCVDGEQACSGDNALVACIDGDLFEFDCDDVCAELGLGASVGCGFDAESGADVCLCG